MRNTSVYSTIQEESKMTNKTQEQQSVSKELAKEYKLIEPSMELKESYIDYITEWENSGEKIVPSATSRQGMAFEELLKSWEEGKTDKVREKGFVPASLYYMIDSSKRIIGALHFRHELNENLTIEGGHIGYGIRPSERRKGLMSYMLAVTLDMLKEKGLTKVLITCDDVNIASAKTIERNGGVLENVIDVEGKLVRRYWISLDKAI